MRIPTPVLLFVLALAVCGCSLTRSDSCTRIREFKQYSWRPAEYQSLTAVEVTTLPPQVRASVAAFSRRLMGDESLFILGARESRPYILLELSGACFDCRRWVVYSPERQCIVGKFVLGGQG